MFIDDDAGYRDWLRGHPGGYVVNSTRPPSRSYLVLHRASCDPIRDRPDFGESFTTTSSKACANTTWELDQWARDEIHGELSRCGTCEP